MQTTFKNTNIFNRNDLVSNSKRQFQITNLQEKNERNSTTWKGSKFRSKMRRSFSRERSIGFKFLMNQIQKDQKRNQIEFQSNQKNEIDFNNF